MKFGNKEIKIGETEIIKPDEIKLSIIKERNDLQKRISKAIEYIEENSDDMHTYISQILTDILKGVDKE